MTCKGGDVKKKCFAKRDSRGENTTFGESKKMQKKKKQLLLREERRAIFACRSHFFQGFARLDKNGIFEYNK